ncbi:MAG: hypothetical protein V8Q36_03130 [Anaerotignum sp.]
MKCIRIKDGVIDSVLLNEACSSGCGSFTETLRKTSELHRCGLREDCSSRKSAHRPGFQMYCFHELPCKTGTEEGADVADISAGLAYPVIKNALLKVIKIADPKAMGKSMVVQGGTFYNDAVLKKL